MKQSQLFLLISNIYLVASFFKEDTSGFFSLWGLGFLWLLGSMLCIKQENSK